jgi:hypothetical protein
MRLLIIILIGLILFLGLCIYSEIWLSNSTLELVAEIEQLEDYLKNDKWEEANSLLLTTQKKWSEIEKQWDIFVDHREMDEIDLALAKLNKYIEIENADFALIEISALKHFVLNISKKESFNLRNIF